MYLSNYACPKRVSFYWYIDNNNNVRLEFEFIIDFFELVNVVSELRES